MIYSKPLHCYFFPYIQIQKRCTIFGVFVSFLELGHYKQSMYGKSCVMIHSNAKLPF